MVRLLPLAGWLIALAWLRTAFASVFGLRRVPDLMTMAEAQQSPEGSPSITVIVPALNEAANVDECLRSLLAQDYANLTILAVDDRSTDATGSIMDSLAAESAGTYPGRLRVLHITELPAGWLGKTHAMALAARQTTSEYILFTDADVLYAPDAIRRSLAYAVASGADHLVTAPTLILKRWDEAAVLGFVQVAGLWAARPWKVGDTRSKRDAIGVGAFNLMRRSAYVQVGGFEALKMEIVEDLGMARRIKKAGLAQRFAFGRGLVRVHWATGANGLAGVLTKNIFSAFRFYVSLVFFACGWVMAFCVLPDAGLFVSGYRLAALLTLLATTTMYRAMGRHSGISAWNVLLMPFGALVLIFAMLRSMVTTLRQGGVVWRGTFYRLDELRKNAAPLW